MQYIYGVFCSIEKGPFTINTIFKNKNDAEKYIEAKKEIIKKFNYFLINEWKIHQLALYENLDEIKKEREIFN